MKLLQIDFHWEGPFGEELQKGLNDLAHSIAQEEGLIWKIWTENDQEKRAGGIYLFETYEQAKNYANKHQERLAFAGASDFMIHFFDVNTPLSLITKAPF